MRLPTARFPNSQAHTTAARIGQPRPAPLAAMLREAPSRPPEEAAYYPVEEEHLAASSAETIAFGGG